MLRVAICILKAMFQSQPLLGKITGIGMTEVLIVDRKTEVSDVLESAGFSKANPYYVVQQGKVNCFGCIEATMHVARTLSM